MKYVDQRKAEILGVRPPAETDTEAAVMDGLAVACLELMALVEEIYRGESMPVQWHKANKAVRRYWQFRPPRNGS